MKKHNIRKIEKQTNNKYLNLYIATYETENGDFKYEFASRNNENDVLIMSKNLKANAVRVVPYFYDEFGKIHVVLIKEFRYAINRMIYGVTAGLVDCGEDIFTAVKRELQEEIGASCVNVIKTEDVSFTSAGLSDETIICFEAEVDLNQKQRLDGNEDIEKLIVDFDELDNLLNTELFGLQSRLQLRAFYYKHKYEELRKKI